MKPRPLSRLLLLATVLIWGATFTLVKSALTDISPLLFNLLRFTLATAALLAINRPEFHRRHLIPGLLTGLFLAAGYQFQTLGLARTTPTNSAFVTGLVVLFVPALTLIPALRPPGTRAPGLASAAGALLGLSGLFFLTIPSGGHLTAISPGDLLTLVAAFAFALHLLTIGHFSRTMPAATLATLQVAFATAFMLLTQPLERHPRAHFTPAILAALIVCALFATAAAFTIQSYAQQHLPPTETVLVLILEPVFGALTAILFLHQHLTARTLIGAALILAGILLTELLPTTHTTEIPA